MAHPFVHSLGDGLYVVDTGYIRPQFDAAFLIVERGRAAFVDTGTNDAVPRLLAALDDLGLAPDDVDHVIPTHVHLDHAGGVGRLMQSLPRATVLVHPRGARHMIDPSVLYQGASAVYGADEMDRSYGRLASVDAARVRATQDGETIALNGRPLYFAHTPGHARHHHCIWDERTRGWFTGDTFGLSYRDFDSARGTLMVPTSTPVQFEPERLRESIARLLARDPQWIYLTHFGRIGDVQRMGRELLGEIDVLVEIAQAHRADPERHTAMKAAIGDRMRRRLIEHGVADVDGAMAKLALDAELNAQGLGVWLDRAAR